MRSVKLTIAGEYWDSQIYASELILFGFDGSMHYIDWRAAIDYLASKNADIQTALRVSFTDSDLFYSPNVLKVLSDPLIKSTIVSQLDGLANRYFEESSNTWSNFWKTGDSALGFLPNDTDVYYNKIFAGADDGLYSASRGVASKSSKIKRQKHHDARYFQLKASHRFTSIAAAVGVDGLLEFPLVDGGKLVAPEKVLATKDCNACDWAFQNVMGWTGENSFVVNFRKERDQRTNRTKRVFDRVIDGETIFKDSRISSQGKGAFEWGSKDKMYRVSDGALEVFDFEPYTLKAVNQRMEVKGESFSQKGKLALNINSSQILATGTAAFGTVIELTDRVLVIRSDGVVESFPGEAMHWRVFPRSENYGNQLHIVYEDRLLIVSYVHDYFVNQKTKMTGSKKNSSSEE